MSNSILDRWSIRASYDKLKDLPMGLAIFSRLLGWVAPYTGTITPRVEKLDVGFARISMDDHRVVRNHLNSVHAVALMNLGEVATGLALHYDLPSESRAILTKLSMEYLKKARGKLYAEAQCERPDSNTRKEYLATAHIYDESKAIVAKATATWLVGPKS